MDNSQNETVKEYYESIFIPVLKFDSINNKYHGEIQDQINDIIFCSEAADTIKNVGKQMIDFANHQIREWERFKTVVDYLGQELNVNK